LSDPTWIVIFFTGLYFQQQHLDTTAATRFVHVLESPQNLNAVELLSAFGLAESERGIGQAATKSIIADPFDVVAMRF
jgi:hypothetical protein